MTDRGTRRADMPQGSDSTMLPPGQRLTAETLTHATGTSPNTSRPAAVVIGNHTQGLGIVRSAGVAGWPAWVVNDSRLSLSRFSRYLTGHRQLPRGCLSRLENATCSEQLLAQLLALPVQNASVLLGVNEDITRFVFEYRQRLRPKYFIPEVAMESVYDKFLFNDLVPSEARIDTWLYERGFQGTGNPERFLVKGRQGNAFRRAIGSKAIRLDTFLSRNRSALLRQLSPEQVIVQRIVASDRPVVSVCSFCVDGEIDASFQYEKLRQHPDQFGTGTYLRSTSVASIQPIAAQVLRALRFTGISEIEFVFDTSAGIYRIIEMNPRTWKSVHFATQCGLNLVEAYLSYTACGRRRTVATYETNRYWADLATDLLQMFRDRTLGVYHRGFHESSWDRTDPLPGLALWTLFPLIGLDRLWTKSS